MNPTDLPDRFAWRKRALVLLSAAALASFGACSDSGSDPEETDVGDDTADATDTGAEVVEDVVEDGDDPSVDVAPDGSGDVGPDAEDATEDTVTVVPCETQEDCPAETLCVDSVCESLACRGPDDWVKCSRLFDRVEPDRGRYATCSQRLCRESCLLDSDCPGENQVCTDFGECQTFTGDLSVAHPHGPATGTLQAGVANLPMNFPIGVPLGGYGDRAAYYDGRYAVSLKSSAGQFHGMFSRAVVLDNGERRLMIIRLPVIFTQMALHEDVARALQARTGHNWRDSLVISSTHTHSGPCRHWHLPAEAAAPLGSFGIGEFNQWFYDWLLEVAVDTALAALDDLSPARIGWEIIEAYDVDDHVGRDRWTQTPQFDDNRTLFIRVDDPEGVPRAVLFSYGAHGTDNGTDYLTGDGVGMSEFAYEARLGEEFGRFIPAFFINQNSGTMGPAGGSIGHEFPMRMERLGWAFLDKTWDTFMGIETTSELTLNTNNLRFPISYDLMGYDRGQFGSDFDRPFGGEYHYGGLSCVGRFGGDSDYATHQRLEDMSCAGALHFLLFNQPPTTLTRSQIMTFELNGLTVGVIPGELSMELSWQMLRMLRDTYGVDPLSAWTFGYANDHLFYLLPYNLRGGRPPFPGMTGQAPPDDYPDFAFSYLQGGYESTMSMWGPYQGDFLLQRLSEAYHQMIDASYELALPEVLPSQFRHRDTPEFEHFTTADSVIGTWTANVPPTVERLQSVEISWMGGDPAAEQPQSPLVTLERQVDEVWTTVTTPSTLPYDNTLPLFVTRVRQATDDADWEWVVRWEELMDFPAGRYRFRVDGHRYDETDTRVPYQVYTDAFDLVPTDDAVVEADVVAGRVEGRAGFPSAERGRFSGPSSDPGRAQGNFRMRHPMVPEGSLPPMESLSPEGVTAQLLDGETVVSTAVGVTVTTAPSSVGGRTIPVTRFAGTLDPVPPAGTYTLSVQVTDAYGNTGVHSSSVTIP